MKKIYVIRYSNGEHFEDYEDYALVAYLTKKEALNEMKYIKNNLKKFYTTDERLIKEDSQISLDNWSRYEEDDFNVYLEEIDLID